MQAALQRMFILALAFCITLAAALGIFLYISLIPFFGAIGRVAAGVVMVGLICVAALLIVGTYSLTGIMISRRMRERSHERIIVAGDVVAYLSAQGDFTHLSAMHESSKIPQVAASKEEPQTDDATILELYKKGMGLRDIAKATGQTYYRVQKVCSGK